MLEAIAKCEEIAGRKLDYELSDDARIGDHQWYVSDLGAFERDYPEWKLTYGIDAVLQEIHDVNLETWNAVAAPR